MKNYLTIPLLFSVSISGCDCSMRKTKLSLQNIIRVSCEDITTMPDSYGDPRVHAISLGMQHLRSELKIPVHIKPFPKYLREAGCFAINNITEDSNFKDNSIWDISSHEAPYKNKGEGLPLLIRGSTSDRTIRIPKNIPS